MQPWVIGLWDAPGVILHQRATITGDYYTNLISKLRDMIKKNAMGSCARANNAPSHKSALPKAEIAEADFE